MELLWIRSDASDFIEGSAKPYLFFAPVSIIGNALNDKRHNRMKNKKEYMMNDKADK